MIHCLPPVHIGNIHPHCNPYCLSENHVEIVVTLLVYKLFCCWVDSVYSDNDLLFAVDDCYPEVLKNLDLDSVDNHTIGPLLVLDLGFIPPVFIPFIIRSPFRIILIIIPVILLIPIIEPITVILVTIFRKNLSCWRCYLVKKIIFTLFHQMGLRVTDCTMSS